MNLLIIHERINQTVGHELLTEILQNRRNGSTTKYRKLTKNQEDLKILYFILELEHCRTVVQIPT